MMTKAQDALYWREWAAVRRIKPDADRHGLHVEALGKDKSHVKFNNKDLDEILRVFRAISRPADLDGQLRLMRMEQTRLLHNITLTQLPCLAVCLRARENVHNPLSVDDYTVAENYLTEIMQDRFHTSDIKSISYAQRPRTKAKTDQSDRSDLECLRDLLDARVNELRNKAGITIHDMLTAAGLECNCRQCCKRLAQTVPGVPMIEEPELAHA